MRIISQNGNNDLPYECSDVIVEDKCIIAISSPVPRLMAEYKSVEKAQKAMDMLHQEYIGIKPNLVIDKGANLNLENLEVLNESLVGVIIKPAEQGDVGVHMLSQIFHFPSDDEIEVQP